MPARRRFVKHLLFWLCPTGIKKTLPYRGIMMRCAGADEHADVVIEVLERERKSNYSPDISMHFRVTAGRHTGVHYGLADGSQWHEAAHSAARHIRNWVVQNYESLIADRA